MSYRCLPFLVQVSPIFGAGIARVWRRWVLGRGTCAANRVCTLSNGAGPLLFSPPAPANVSTCTSKRFHLRQQTFPPAPANVSTCASEHPHLRQHTFPPAPVSTPYLRHTSGPGGRWAWAGLQIGRGCKYGGESVSL